MDIKQLARSLGITQQSAITRGVELLRLLKLKIPGGLGQGEICRPAVCLELACQTTPGSKLPIREEFIRYSCSAPKVYNEVFTRIQRILDVRPTLQLQELVTLFGCSQLHDSVQQLLTSYKSRFLESLPAAERARADLTRPAFLAAAFLLSAKKHRARVDRAALTTKMGLTRTELDSAMHEIASRCADQLALAGTRKRERCEGDTAADAEGAHGEAAGGAKGQSVGKRTRRTAGRNIDEEDEEDGRATDVAVEDFKLVLIGLGPAAGGAAAADEAAGPSGSRRQGVSRQKAKSSVRRTRVAQSCDEGQEAGDGAVDGDGVAA